MKCLQWLRIKAKIQSKLPNYHPLTGIRLYWDIQLVHPVIRYNQITGKRIKEGYPKMVITQQRPMGLKDPNVYAFDWKKKELYRVEHMRWNY